MGLETPAGRSTSAVPDSIAGRVYRDSDKFDGEETSPA